MRCRFASRDVYTRQFCFVAIGERREKKKKKKEKRKKKRKARRGKRRVDRWLATASFLFFPRLYNAVKGEKTRVKRLSSYTLCEDKFSIARAPLSWHPAKPIRFLPPGELLSTRSPLLSLSLSRQRIPIESVTYFLLFLLFLFLLLPIYPSTKKKGNEAASRDDYRDIASTKHSVTNASICLSNKFRNVQSTRYTLLDNRVRSSN